MNHEHDDQGVSRALLIGLPAAGHSVTQALPAAIEAYNQAGLSRDDARAPSP